MRFQDLSQEAIQGIWNKWKYIVHELLDEFNEDVFHGRGIVQENSYQERDYLMLETKTGCLYVFPMPGDIFILRVYWHKIEKECLSLKNTAGNFNHENFIGEIGVAIGIIEERYTETSGEVRRFLAESLRRIYKKY